MEHILNEIELKELHDEYYAIDDRIRQLEMRQYEIDHAICRNSCNIVASRFIPLELYDKIKVTKSTWCGYNRPEITTEMVGFFGLFRLEGHPYTADDGVHQVRLRLYQVKKDGTPSQRYEDIYGGSIVSIEKVVE